ncbi:diacylglycerol/lipid kinase family protein [Paenibacillus dakarensis]|uniref:diacylglycerol/lipid kinase family protein n=1 Tax=Paenibacillus dakarensis TaxID=1527293 RepID=UPI0006D5B470|nr:diacylglycerol kinase family protein [Paenibacillus dakarensis]
MKQALVIINPSSGKEKAVNYLEDTTEILRSQGYSVTVRETEKERDATHFCVNACEQGFSLVVSIGGDGTLHETINGLIDQPHCPKLGVIPLGTVNDFARALHIPLDPEQAIQALRSSRIQKVDLGCVNEQLFVNVIAAGSIAQSLSSVSSKDKSRLGAFAYLKEGFKELMNTPVHPLRIRYDDKVWEGESRLFLTALTNSVGGFEKLAPDAEVDDGLLHCFIIKDLSIFSTISVSLSLLLGSLKNHSDVIYFTAKHVHVSSPQSVMTNVDGEEGPPLPIDLRVMPRYIEVILPEEPLS